MTVLSLPRSSGLRHPGRLMHPLRLRPRSQADLRSGPRTQSMFKPSPRSSIPGELGDDTMTAMVRL
jgi:hypothetical protein